MSEKAPKDQLKKILKKEAKGAPLTERERELLDEYEVSQKPVSIPKKIQLTNPDTKEINTWSATEYTEDGEEAYYSDGERTLRIRIGDHETMGLELKKKSEDLQRKLTARKNIQELMKSSQKKPVFSGKSDGIIYDSHSKPIEGYSKIDRGGKITYESALPPRKTRHSDPTQTGTTPAGTFVIPEKTVAEHEDTEDDAPKTLLEPETYTTTTHTYMDTTLTSAPGNTEPVAPKTIEKKEDKKNLNEKIIEILDEPGVTENLREFFSNAYKNGIVAGTHGGSQPYEYIPDPNLYDEKFLAENPDMVGTKVIPQPDLDAKLSAYILHMAGIPVKEQRFVEKGAKFNSEKEDNCDLYFDVAENGKLLSVIKDPKTERIHVTLGNHYNGVEEKTSSADILYRVLKIIESKDKLNKKILGKHTSYTGVLKDTQNNALLNQKRKELGLEPYKKQNYSKIEKKPLTEEQMQELIKFNNDTDNLLVPSSIEKDYRDTLPKTLYGQYRFIPFEKIVEHFASGRKATDPMKKEILERVVGKNKKGENLTQEQLIRNYVANAELGIKNANKEMDDWGMNTETTELGRVLVNNQKTSNIGMREVIFARQKYDSNITIGKNGAFISKPGENLQNLFEKIKDTYPEAKHINSMILYFPKNGEFNEREFLKDVGIEYAPVKKSDVTRIGTVFIDEQGTQQTVTGIDTAGFVSIVDNKNHESTEELRNIIEYITKNEWKVEQMLSVGDTYTDGSGQTFTIEKIVEKDAERYIEYKKDGKMEKVKIPYAQKMINEGVFKKVEKGEEIKDTKAEAVEEKTVSPQELVSGIATYSESIAKKLQQELKWPQEVVEVLTVKEIAQFATEGGSGRIYGAADIELFKERVRLHKIEKIKAQLTNVYTEMDTQRKRITEIDIQIEAYEKRNQTTGTVAQETISSEVPEIGEPEKIAKPIELSLEDKTSQEYKNALKNLNIEYFQKLNSYFNKVIQNNPKIRKEYEEEDFDLTDPDGLEEALLDYTANSDKQKEAEKFIEELTDFYTEEFKKIGKKYIKS